MDTTPKLSVIVELHNDEGQIEQCLRSVLDQSLKEIEVICVGYASVDSSVQVIRRIADEDSRIAFVSFDNEDLVAARNAGLEAATGEYVHFLSANDYVLDYAYEALYNKLLRYNLDCIKFSSITFDGSQGETVVDKRLSLAGLREGDFNRVFSHNPKEKLFSLPVEAWSGIYRRAFLHEYSVSFQGPASMCDWPFFVRVITIAPRIAAARDRLVLHRLIPKEQPSLSYMQQGIEALQIVERQLVADGISDEMTERLLHDGYIDVTRQCKVLTEYEEYAEEAVNRVEELLDGVDYDFLHNTIWWFSSFRNEVDWRVEKLGLAREMTSRGEKLPSELEDLLAAQDEQPEEKKPKPCKVFHEACNAPKVTVVVPIYNQEEYLNQALHSLTTQLLEEMEFVCVNDGSTDESMTIMREYASVDKRFRIIDKANTGYGNSMNVGIDEARGEYLGILEPDDYVPANMFRNLYNVASNNDLDFVKADFYRFWISDEGATKKREFKLTSDAGFYRRIVNPSEELETFNFVMNTWSGIYKLAFLNEWNIRHNETPGASYQDNGFWFQTFARATRAWFAPTPYYMNRRDNPNSSMFDKGKFYAVTNEYRFIENWLRVNPDITERFLPILYKKKFSNFIYTYYRLAREHKRDYLKHFREEFKPLLDAGLIDEELLGTTYWKMLNDIVTDPDTFCDKLCVSVVIPAYNAEKYIGACLDSILVRDEIRIEVICVDDGSTDGTLNILRQYEQADQRVRVITQKNAGAGAARNNGMQYASGEYLAFLDADDFFEPDMLRRAYEKAYDEDSDVVVFRSDNYNEMADSYSGMPNTIRFGLLPHTRPFAGIDIERDIFKAFVGWPWDKLFRTEFVRENALAFQEQRTTNDLLFVFAAIARAQRISVMGSVLAHHRRLEAGGSLSVSRELSWNCFYNALRALRDQLRQWGLYDRFEQDYINYALHSCLWNVNSLKGSSYRMLYDELKNGWFEDLGVTDKGRLYFYNAQEYDQLQTILELDADGYLFYRLDKASDEANRAKEKASNLQSQVGVLSRQLKTARKKAKSAELKLVDASVLLDERDAEIRKATAKLKKTRAKAQKATEAAQALENQIEHDEKPNSVSIGKMASSVPRKILEATRGRKK